MCFWINLLRSDYVLTYCLKLCVCVYVCDPYFAVSTLQCTCILLKCSLVNAAKRHWNIMYDKQHSNMLTLYYRSIRRSKQSSIYSPVCSRKYPFGAKEHKKILGSVKNQTLKCTLLVSLPSISFRVFFHKPSIDVQINQRQTMQSPVGNENDTNLLLP